MIITCVIILIFVFLMIVHCCKIRSIKIWIIGPLAFIVIILYIARFVLSIILLYYIEKGDIEKYDKFLDCKNINTKFFKNFSDVNELRKCFLLFLF